MSKLKALNKNLNLAEKRIILRVDLNVPMLKGKVTDKSRINKVIPIIKEFTKKKAKVILISHLGRPKGKIDEKLSLKPIAPVLENLLKSKVYFSDKSYGSTVIKKSNEILLGSLLSFFWQYNVKTIEINMLNKLGKEKMPLEGVVFLNELGQFIEAWSGDLDVISKTENKESNWKYVDDWNICSSFSYNKLWKLHQQKKQREISPYRFLKNAGVSVKNTCRYGIIVL